WDEALVEQSFGERASERRDRKTALILLGAAVLSGLVFLLFGGGPNGMAAALTSMLCMGAPLSSTLVAGIASLRLQKTPAAAGAVVPGWAAIEELGGVDTVQVDSDELFTADRV
ncbi:cell envelope biogenesis protein OmpA, partial [Faecalibacterium sp. DFI.5.82]|nr:cell envelope biogenesis protein OmpA [Faecalibacterium sp. DFI.5.82]